MKIAITVWQSATTGGPTTAGSVGAGPVADATRTPEARPRAVASADHAPKDAKHAISNQVSGPNAPADIVGSTGGSSCPGSCPPAEPG